MERRPTIQEDLATLEQSITAAPVITGVIMDRLADEYPEAEALLSQAWHWTRFLAGSAVLLLLLFWISSAGFDGLARVMPDRPVLSFRLPVLSPPAPGQPPTPFRECTIGLNQLLTAVWKGAFHIAWLLLFLGFWIGLASLRMPEPTPTGKGEIPV